MIQRKTGSKNPESDWAKARVTLATQLQDQLALGKQIDAGKITYSDAIHDNEFPPLWTDGILQCDENHVVQSIGGAGHAGAGSHFQYPVSVDAATGIPTPWKDGGVMPEKCQRVVPKYTKEARGYYGVAIPTVDSASKPQFMDTFNYTEKTLRSKKQFDKLITKELAYRRFSKYNGWAPFKDDNPYEQRYGDEWEKHLLQSPSMQPSKSVEHMMDHIISEGQQIFKGTKQEDTWMIYHNHLKIWWEKETQDYLKTLLCPIEGWPDWTWYDQQIRICGPTNNKKVSKYYANCLPGDSLEMMALDCHLFADVQEGAAKNVALTFHISKDDDDFADKYSFATPCLVYDSLQQTIKAGCPSPKRIQEDMEQIFGPTLERIIKAEGTYIKDTSKKFRSGAWGALEAAEQKLRREAIPFDSKAMESFNNVLIKLEKGEGVSFKQEELAPTEVVALMEVVCISNDKDKEEDDNNEHELVGENQP